MTKGLALLRCTLALALFLACGSLRAEEPFTFMVHGCMPYDFPDDHQRYLNLIDTVNEAGPAFTVHLGDTKSGSSPCTDEKFGEIHDYFMRFEGPLIYSIGDNEWTDCHREKCGEFDPIERLARIREVFFPTDASLGQSPLLLKTQRGDTRHSAYVEHGLWSQGGVVFATLHVVGSNNNLRPEDPAAVAEYEARDLAVRAWLIAAFTEARREDHRAVALFIQANPFANNGEARSDGFENFIEILRQETLRFGKPVVLFHADSHYFRIDKPLRYPKSKQSIENFTRVESFGAENMHLVEITVDPADPGVFTFRERLVTGNRRQ